MYKQAVIIGVWYDGSMKRKFRVNKKMPSVIVMLSSNIATF